VQDEEAGRDGRHRPAPELFGALLTAADRAGVGIVILRVAPTLKAVFVSSRCAQIMGISVDELLERPPLQLFPPERLAEIQQVLARHRAGDLPPPTFESRIRRGDGREVALEFGIGATEVDGQPGSVLFMRDATEAAQAKETLRRSEARWRTLIESAPDAILISRDRRIVYANPAAARLFGCERPEELRGASFVELMPEAEVEAMVESTVAPHPAREYRARSRQGREMLIEVTSMPFDDLDGPAVIGFARDVTESRRLQAQLIHADRLAALGTMAAGVAHEIKNPLGFIQLAVDAIERDYARAPTSPPGASPDDPIPPMLADIRQGAERIANITRQLTDFSRADDETAPRHPVAALDRVLANACRLVEPQLRRLGTLVRAFAALPAVRGDGRQLEQVFVNLLINAVQALNPARSNGRVEIGAAALDDRVLVRVSDNGVGISKENLRRVCDPFFTTKPAGTGTGLGLSICQKIVTQLGGEVGIESEEGRGTTVTVSLPIAATVVEEAGRSAPVRLAAHSRMRILIVDDEEAILRILHRSLAETHDVVVVSSGMEASEHLHSGDFDLVLLDVMMPVIGGLELCELIGRDRPGLLGKVVLMTGSIASEQVTIGGATIPVLSKPFSMKDIEALLERYRPLTPVHPGPGA
jgi:PAS domain S-box-containing protein